MQRISILILLVVTNSMVAAAHAATHMQAEPSECELCATYGDPADAIPAERLPITFAGKYSYPADFSDLAHDTSAIFGYRQRGPPLTI